MELIREAATITEASCNGYNTQCWCNDVACQGQDD